MTRISDAVRRGAMRSRLPVAKAVLWLGMLAGAGFCPHSAEAADLFKDQVPSTVSVSKDDKGFHIRTESRYYVYNSFVAATVDATTTAPLLRQILLIEKSSAVTEADNEDPSYEPSQIKVTVYPLTEKGRGAAAFTIAATGEDVKVDNDSLIVSRPGCCVEYTTKAVYSLETGKYLFNTTNDQWATLGAKGGFAMSRSAAAHIAPTEADDVVFGKVEHAGAVISYASPTAPLQRLMVVLPKDAADDTTLNWDGTLLWVSGDYPDGTNHIYVDRVDKPENVFTGVSLRFRLDESTVIDIPLRGDRLDAASAKLPKGYVLKEVPVN